MPASTMRPVRSSAWSRDSSSRHALSGPDSSQHATQRAPHRLVSCQARKRGASYSNTERPCIATAARLSEADVRLRHHLLGDVLELGLLPLRLRAGLVLGRGLRGGLGVLCSHDRFAHPVSLVVTAVKTASLACQRLA